MERKGKKLNTQKSKANYLGISRQYYNMILQGKVTPSKQLKDAIDTIEKGYLPKYKKQKRIIPEPKLLKISRQQDIPECLSDIEEVKQFLISDRSYIYFLFKGNNLHYIGSTDCLEARLLAHMVYTSQKDFDSVFYIQVDRDARYELEQYYIKKYDPPRNRRNVLCPINK